jgi:hypothetical protein
VSEKSGTAMQGEKVDKLQEYATDEQIEFFDRLRPGKFAKGEREEPPSHSQVL